MEIIGYRIHKTILYCRAIYLLLSTHAYRSHFYGMVWIEFIFGLAWFFSGIGMDKSMLLHDIVWLVMALHKYTLFTTY